MNSLGTCMISNRTNSINLRDEYGISLIEMIVAIVLLTIAIGAITGMLISSMRSQQEVSADIRSQLNMKQTLYDMEKQIAEAKRRDDLGNEPVFQDDLISFPSQNGSVWITYIYTDQHPSSMQPTIVRVDTDGMPTLPLYIQSSDKQMINVDPENSEVATVERVSDGAPIFKYYGEDGNQMVTPVAEPRLVRFVEVSIKTTVSNAHAQDEPTVSTIKISLRNF